MIIAIALKVASYSLYILSASNNYIALLSSET